VRIYQQQREDLRVKSGVKGTGVCDGIRREFVRTELSGEFARLQVKDARVYGGIRRGNNLA
jgi:hypothetical protein